MVTLLHTADTHLGYRQYHRPEREADFRDAFYHVIDEAVSRDVDAVVHAGDLFNSSRPGIEALSDALEGLTRLSDARIPFLSIVGNHDGTRERQWLDVFASLGLAVRLDASGYSLGNETAEGTDGSDGGDTTDATDGASKIVLYGLDHVEPGRRDRLDYAFDTEAARNADSVLLVAHGLFAPFPNGDWDARAICRQSTVAFDAILAGDDHTNKKATLSEFDTLLTYPGSTERTAADQRDPRKFDLVTCTPNGMDVDSEELDTRRFVYVDVELGEEEGLDRVLGEIDETAEEFAKAVVVVTITGTGERVSSGPVEEVGLAREALAVRVNDRRELSDELAEYGEVAFVDPDEAVIERLEGFGASENGRELEALVRNGDSVPDSNVTDVVETRVREWLDERPLPSFERTESDTAGSPNASETTSSTGSTDSTDSTDAADTVAPDETETTTEAPETDGNGEREGIVGVEAVARGKANGEPTSGAETGSDAEPEANEESEAGTEASETDMTDMIDTADTIDATDAADADGADSETRSTERTPENGNEKGENGDEGSENGDEAEQERGDRTTQSTLWD